MKKLLAICLTFIMVISVLAVPAFAATVEVQAKTLVDQSFVGLSEAPADWTVTSNNGTVSYEPTCFQFKNGTGQDAKYAKLAYGSAFNTNGKEYTFSFKLYHYDGNSYIHFGADSAANAIVNNTNVDGFTLFLGIGRNNDYTKGYYDLYLDGTLLGTIIDPGSNYGYRSLREFKFVVTEDGVTATIGGAGETYFEIPEDAAADFEGYVGCHLGNNTGHTTGYPVKLSDVKLVSSAYSYEVDASQKTTGAYAVTGSEYVESHTGTMYYNQSLAGLSAGNAPAGVTIPSSNITYGADYIQLKEFTNPTVNFGTKTVNEGAWTIETKYSANPTSNKVQFYFLGYQLRTGQNDGGIKLYQGSTLIAEAGTSAYSPWGNGHVTVPVVKIEYADGKMNVYMDDYHVLKDVEIANPTYTGEVKFFNNYAGNIKIYYVKMYTPDYADTSSYVDIKKTNFILDKTFTSADNADSLAALGFTAGGANVAYTNDGIKSTQQGTVSYTGAKIGGAYTAEFVTHKPFQETVVYLNASSDFKNAYTVYAVYNAPVKISKVVNGTSTELVLSTGAGVNPGDNINVGFKTYKVTVEPQENGDVKIIANIAGKTWEATDVKSEDNAPYTEGFMRVYQQSWGRDAYVKSVKVYPTSVEAPAYEGKFDIGGNVASAAVKGNTYFTFPVTMLGQAPDFIAALYEDGKMSDIKFFDVEAANAGPVELFDTTASTANKVEIKVFVWDTLEGMVPVLAPFTLD